MSTSISTTRTSDRTSRPRLWHLAGRTRRFAGVLVASIAVAVHWSPSSASAASTATDPFVASALAQAGDRYVFGIEVRPADPDPTAFDSAELAEWAAAQAGVALPDGAWHQYRALHGRGLAMPVTQGLMTRGALLFAFSSDPVLSPARPTLSHVAISLGDGKTIEARGTQWKVGSWDASGRFGYAARLVP